MADSLDTIGSRLLHIQQLTGVSAREFDRLANRPEGHFSIIVHRLRKNPESKVDLDVAADYCAAAGVPLEWLAKGEGHEPTERSVTLAIKRARVEHERRAAHTVNDCGGGR
jgi:hypothetical protein